MKNSQHVHHKQFKDGQEHVYSDAINGQPKMQMWTNIGVLTLKIKCANDNKRNYNRNFMADSIRGFGNEKSFLEDGALNLD